MRAIKFKVYNIEQAEPPKILEPVNFSNKSAIMQYTGLKDKNGKEIYEGDVVRLPNEYYKGFQTVGWEGTEDGIYEIYWDEETGSFHGREASLDNGLYIWLVAKYSEIIGNIWENPELIKEYDSK